VASAEAFVRHRPRVAAAVSFGVAGTALPALRLLPSVLSRRDGVAFVLYIAAPGLAAALAGALAGGPLCDPARTRGSGRAVLRGAAVATLALVIFAPPFAVLFAWGAPGRTSVVGMTVLVLTFSFVAVWWVVAPVGAGLGWLLHHLASRRDAA
jgi:hypothetical protein